MVFVLNFNSNMVRLKAGWEKADGKKYFYFNSNMVRLKELTFNVVSDVFGDFNSNMVRLKVDLVTSFSKNVIFQFQHGAIKRPVNHVA